MEDKIKGHDDEIVFARVRTSTLEILIDDIQIRHRSDMKSLLDKIHELKNHKGDQKTTVRSFSFTAFVRSNLGLCGIINDHLSNFIYVKFVDKFLCDVSYLYVSRMAPKRTPTSAAPAISQAAIKKLVADSVAAALEAQAATMANTDNTTRNTGPRGNS
ncbi:hypothetical protein Tco_0817514 [Tanacetum coccineum]